MSLSQLVLFLSGVMSSVSDPKRLFPDPTFQVIPDPDPFPDPRQYQTFKEQNKNIFTYHLEVFSIGLL